MSQTRLLFNLQYLGLHIQNWLDGRLLHGLKKNLILDFQKLFVRLALVFFFTFVGQIGEEERLAIFSVSPVWFSPLDLHSDVGMLKGSK